MYSQINNKYCNNCGKNGHIFYNCKYPITSIGIISYRFNNETNNFEYLMIRRKDSLGYVDFLRGKYVLNNVLYIQNIIDEMTIREKCRLLHIDFDTLWRELWNSENESKYEKEKIISKNKFETLKNGISVNNEYYSLEIFLNKSKTNWSEQEWGFPKGRRDNQENDLETALREFCEETGFTKDDIDIIENLIPLEEIFCGSNFKCYKHKYYLAHFKDYHKSDSNNYQMSEVSKLEWKSLEQCLSCIRPYNLEKKKIITNINKLLNKYKIKN
jgi:8-oxo-dGTP pyrophosphatase MutT (NUDIX family)